MENFYNSMKTIIIFLIIMIMISVMVGEKSAQNMAMFILLGMLLINSDNIVTFLKKLK